MTEENVKKPEELVEDIVDTQTRHLIESFNFNAAQKVCNQGDWYHMGEASYRILSSASIVAFNTFKEKANLNIIKRTYNGEAFDFFQLHVVFTELFTENPEFMFNHIVSDWKNVKVDGKEMAYNLKNFLELVNNYPIIISAIATICAYGNDQLSENNKSAEEKKI